MFDGDPWAEFDALETERAGADAQQAALDAAGDAIARAEKAGRCCHGSAVGYRNPPVYPEQEGLRPGQLRCIWCKRVFAGDAEWAAAIDAAITGDDQS